MTIYRFFSSKMNAWIKTVQYYYFTFHNKTMAFNSHPTADTLLQ